MFRSGLACRLLCLILLACAADANPVLRRPDQHRELRVQRALRAGDLTPGEAMQLRERWERARRERQDAAARERAAAAQKRNNVESEAYSAPESGVPNR